jgi:peroxiredoxin
MAGFWRRAKTPIKLALGLTLGLIIGVWLFGWPIEPPRGGLGATQHNAAPGPAPYEGSRAPDFALLDLGGGEIRLSDLKGDVVLVNFWATWCGPCQLEMPDIQERFSQYHDQGFTVVAVNFDENPDVVAAFKEDLGLTFDVVLDPGALVQRQYQITGYPTSIFVDREGVIQVRHVGLLDPSQLDRYLRGMGMDL